MGANWTLFNDGFPANTAVQAFTISGTYIFAGIRLEPHGVWRRPLSEVVNDIEVDHYYNSFNLYPIPAFDIITLNIDNRNNDDLTLNIYNVTGTLVKSEMLKQNQRQINIVDLSNGIYMVEVKTKKWTEKQKLIIQK